VRVQVTELILDLPAQALKTWRPCWPMPDHQRRKQHARAARLVVAYWQLRDDLCARSVAYMGNNAMWVGRAVDRARLRYDYLRDSARVGHALAGVSSGAEKGSLGGSALAAPSCPLARACVRGFSGLALVSLAGPPCKAWMEIHDSSGSARPGLSEALPMGPCPGQAGSQVGGPEMLHVSCRTLVPLNGRCRSAALW